MTNPRRRASLYARLSVAADAENVSLDGMVDDMRSLCQREGLEEVALHIDDGQSGGYRDRTAFNAWLDDARHGRCEVLVNPVTDRLTREGLNVAASILDVVEGKNPETGRPSHRPVRLVDCNGLDSLHGDAFRFRFVIQAEVGRAERERIRDRSRRRTKRLREAGRWPGGPVPFGYRAVENPDGPGWVLAIEPAEAQHLREAAEAVLRGDTLAKVARRLNHGGIKPRRAKEWHRITLRKTLTGDHILGRLTVNGRPVRDEDGEILQPFPAVLTVAQVSAIRAKLAGQVLSPRTRGRELARLLSGLLLCHSCGCSLQVAMPRPDRPVYRCNTRTRGGVCGQAVTVSALPIEEHVTGRYLSAVGHLPMYRERTVVTGLEELSAVEEDIKDTMADMATNATAETFERLQRLQARRDELAAMDPDSRTELVATGLTMEETWQGCMTADKRDLLADAFEELVVLPGQRGKHGFDPARLIARWRDSEEG